jgi:hypothetical protein
MISTRPLRPSRPYRSHCKGKRLHITAIAQARELKDPPHSGIRPAPALPSQRPWVCGNVCFRAADEPMRINVVDRDICFNELNLSLINTHANERIRI